ncbi:MAG: hypothetical protein K2X77_34230 [Candidatus Obscuribacterales bacterium]|nr:hypothetical protein [Candidatus Obscuribacterales bacterium]
MFFAVIGIILFVAAPFAVEPFYLWQRPWEKKNPNRSEINQLIFVTMFSGAMFVLVGYMTC